MYLNARQRELFLEDAQKIINFMETGKMTCCNDSPRQRSMNFTYIRPSEELGEQMGKIRAYFNSMEDLIKDNTTKSREQSLALTSLEQCLMYVMKAMCLDEMFAPKLDSEESAVMENSNAHS